MKKKVVLKTATRALALAISLATVTTATPITAEAAKTSAATSNIASRVKAIPEVKTNGGVLPASVYDYNVYSQYADLRAAFGTNQAAYYNHFLTNGIKEGRTASASFNVLDYKDAYADLQAAFGDDLVAYIAHFLSCGIAEGRTGVGSRFSGTYVAPAAGNSQTVSQSASTAAGSSSQGSFTKVGYSQMVKSLNKIAAVKSNGGKLPSSIYDYNVYSQQGDLKAAFGGNKDAYYKHFLENGIYEGRTASANFNLKDYMNNNADLRAAFGGDAAAYINHYLTCGYKENRVTIGGGSAAVAAPSVAAPAPAPSNPTPSQPSQPTNPTPTPTPEVIPSPSPEATQPPVVSDGYNKDMAVNTFNEINVLRVAAGLDKLVWNETLYECTTVRAKEIVSVYDHMRPNGTLFSTVTKDMDSEFKNFGEIIAVTKDTTATNAWYNSAGHKKLMLDEMNYYGATAVYYTNGQYYSVTLFAESSSNYKFDPSNYTLESWTLSDGSTITAREYDKMKWEYRKLDKEYRQEDGSYKYPSKEAEEYYTALMWKFYDAQDCYFNAGGN